MATVNLGSIKFKWKGTYAGGTAYTIDDVVEYNGSSYICIQASTGNLPTNATYFEQMSSAGTNGTDGADGADGTDVGTVITTQGDILYRDGSGLQRLGAGTAGQVLQTGGTGANPSWGTVSSDYVKITSGSISSANSLTLSSFDTSTYKTFVLVLNNMINKTSFSSPLYLNFRYGSSNYTSNNHVYALDGYRVYQGVGTININSSSNLESAIRVNYNTGRDASLDQTQSLILTFTNMDSGNQKDVYIQSFGTSRQSNTDESLFYVNGFGTVRTGVSMDGIRLNNSSDSWGADYKLYGIK